MVKRTPNQIYATVSHELEIKPTFLPQVVAKRKQSISRYEKTRETKYMHKCSHNIFPSFFNLLYPKGQKPSHKLSRFQNVEVPKQTCLFDNTELHQEFELICLAGDSDE